MNHAWIIVTEDKQVGALVTAVKELGVPLAAVAVGPRTLADAAAIGPDIVKWIETSPEYPIEAYAAPVAQIIAADAPKAVLASATPEARVLGGAVAARMGAAVIPGGLKLSASGAKTLVERVDLDGRVIETVETSGAVVAFYAGDDVPSEGDASASIEAVPTEDVADIRIEKIAPAAGADAGINKAAVVVSVGRGLKKKDDLAIIQSLAKALGAEIGCSMPVADDLGWIEKERYVGRSGQHITPQLYIAVGIQGAPQHLEGIRGTKVVVAINNDPEAPIFKAADYGIVGDLYEVVPALQAALGGQR